MISTTTQCSLRQRSLICHQLSPQAIANPWLWPLLIGILTIATLDSAIAK